MSGRWLRPADLRRILRVGKRRAKLSALGSRLSALGSRLSALGSRLSALGSRLSALGSRLSALGSRLSALGSRLSALGSRLSALGSRLSALGSRLHTQVLKLTRSRCAAHQQQFRGFFLGDDLAVAGRKQCPVPCQRAQAKRPARIGRRYRCAIQRGARPPSRHFLQRSLLSTIDRTKPGCFPLRVLGLGPSEPSAGKCSTARLCHRSPSNVTPFETRALWGIPCR